MATSSATSSRLHSAGKPPEGDHIAVDTFEIHTLQARPGVEDFVALPRHRCSSVRQEWVVWSIKSDRRCRALLDRQRRFGDLCGELDLERIDVKGEERIIAHEIGELDQPLHAKLGQ